jgi:hypothetical protein
MCFYYVSKNIKAMQYYLHNLEKSRFKDTIKDYNSIMKGVEKL